MRETDKRCKYCGSTKVTKRGVTSQGKQRWFCHKCGRTWSKPRRKYKTYSPNLMFRDYLSGRSIQEIAEANRIPLSHAYRIISERLAQPVIADPARFEEAKYVAFDGKFLFGRTRTALVLYDTVKNIPLMIDVVKSESKPYIVPFLETAKELGCDPLAVTSDGLGTIPECIRQVWPKATHQRCLFHINKQVTSWVRKPAKTEAGRVLKTLIDHISKIKTWQQVAIFDVLYKIVKDAYWQDFTKYRTISKRSVDYRVYYDLSKCVTLIDNARSDMFHHLDDHNIAPTTSGLEGFNKQIQKIRAFDHCGQTKQHITQHLKHYVNTKQPRHKNTHKKHTK